MRIRNGLVSVTQRRGLITLIPKKNKAANLLKNWRPVTLLNCDYKIASKCIASRIQKFLPRLIDNDQTGFLQKRFIGENIRFVNSLINYANIEQIPGLLLFIDFVHYKSWFKAGEENVQDLLDEASRLISFDVFVGKFKVKTNYLKYYKVVPTLTRYKKLCSPINRNDQTQDATILRKILQKSL